MNVPACFAATDPGVERILAAVEQAAPPRPKRATKPSQSGRVLLDSPPFRRVGVGKGRPAQTPLNHERESLLDDTAEILGAHIGIEVTTSRMMRVAIFCFAEWLHSLDDDDPERQSQRRPFQSARGRLVGTYLSADELSIVDYYADMRRQGLYSFARDAVDAIEEHADEIVLWVRTCRIMWAMRIREERLIQEVLQKAGGPMHEEDIIAAVLAMPKDYGWPVEYA